MLIFVFIPVCKGQEENISNLPMRKNSLTLLSPSKHYFYPRPVYQLSLTPQQLGHEIDGVMKQFKRIENSIENIFKDDDKYPLMGGSFRIPIWSAIYVNLQKTNINPEFSVTKKLPYAVALSFMGQFDEAIQIGLQLIELDDNNYGAMVFLGMHSAQRKELFDYLEKAFKHNPIKTIYLLDWQSKFLKIEVDDNTSWDFVDSYLRLIIENQNIIEGQPMQLGTAITLSQTIIAKYYCVKEGKRVLIECDDNFKRKINRTRRYLNLMIQKQNRKEK